MDVGSYDNFWAKVRNNCNLAKITDNSGDLSKITDIGEVPRDT